MTANKYELKRHIPADVAREVRRRDGYGCIICGCAYYEYEHIGTEFKDAKEHSADEIVLLCIGCHGKKTKGVLSTETIQRHRLSPFCRQNGHSWGEMDIGIEPPEIIIGNLKTKNVKSLITINGENIFSISAPPEKNLPFLLNASIYGYTGKQILRIVDNNFQVSSGSWDVEIKGRKIKIRSGRGVFELVMRVDPPHSVVIERLNMRYKEYEISCNEGQPTRIKSKNINVATDGMTLNNGEQAIVLDNDQLIVGSQVESMYIEKLCVNHLDDDEFCMLPEKMAEIKQSRNNPCHCGSGKKYKLCHGTTRW